jgi:hypothetical protein
MRTSALMTHVTLLTVSLKVMHGHGDTPSDV